MPRNANAFTMSIVAEIFATFPNRFRFTSGIRSQSQNQAVGGVANSFHLTGQAADFVAVNGQYPLDERNAIKRIVARYGYELVYHNAGSGYHYHIEPAPNFTGVTTTGNSLPTNNNNGGQPQTPTTADYALYAGIGLLALYLLNDY